MRPITVDNIEKEIRQIVAEILEVGEEKIKPDVKFVEDLGMDSMMALEILASMEKKYNIKIPEEYLNKVTDINSMLEIARKLIT